MRFSSLARTDLAINMTLAETFLLLMFVVWYGHTAILRQDPVARMKERLDRLEKENERLTKELKRANNQITDLTSRLELWRQLTGFESPPTPEGFTEWRKEACRSHPKCEQNNVLVHASVIRGQVSMVWLTESPKFTKWFTDAERTAVGVTITERRTIQRFLDAVRDYYANERVNGADCRFDYRLTYGSKEDYFDGREFFENYFYPAGLSRRRVDVR